MSDLHWRDLNPRPEYGLDFFRLGSERNGNCIQAYTVHRNFALEKHHLFSALI